MDSCDFFKEIHDKKKKIKQQYSSLQNTQSKFKFELGPLICKSKASAKEFVSLWLKTSYDNYVVDDEDKEWIYALLDRHHGKTTKLSNHNGQVYVRKNNVCTKHFNFYLGKDPPYEDTLFSYLKCFDSKLSTNHVYHCKKAFRNEISPQTLECRQNYFKDRQEILCPMTGMVLKNDEFTHIDHHEKPFMVLMNDFLANNNIDCEKIKLTYDNGQDHFIADPKMKENWKLYHQEHAKLVPVLREWNLGRKNVKMSQMTHESNQNNQNNGKNKIAKFLVDQD